MIVFVNCKIFNNKWHTILISRGGEWEYCAVSSIASGESSVIRLFSDGDQIDGYRIEDGLTQILTAHQKNFSSIN